MGVIVVLEDAKCIEEANAAEKGQERTQEGEQRAGTDCSSLVSYNAEHVDLVSLTLSRCGQPCSRRVAWKLKTALGILYLSW